MTKIRTFVFMDIEGTDLPSVITPKITEIAFTACLRENLLGVTKNEIPRTLHKLSIPINPQRPIHPDAEAKTGLNIYMLEHLKKMNENTIDLFKCFFNQIIAPVCLVAHNGNKYDFPILKHHLNQLGCSFHEDLLSVDSLEIFKICAPDISYKQCDVFQRLHGYEPTTAHTAEADTISLLMCAIAKQHDFVRLSDSMATKFNEL